MEQERTETRSITADQQKRIEEVCFRSLALIGRNCEYLEQHFGSTGADEPARQAVVDINAAAAQLDRTLSEAMTLLEFLRADKKPQLYPMDLCELLQQVAAQADMIRAQLGVDIRLDYGSHTTCCVMADRSDAELLCLHLLSNALRASREGGSVDITLCRTESDWKLTFADAGCGLPGEDAQAALENRRSFLGGAQLGLVLCQECCRRMGWSLQLESAPQKGTKAVVSIPLHTADDRPDSTVELRADTETEREQRRYHLRAMLVREMRTMPERGDPEELLL
jgi:signal transduction histidine kinase